MKLSGKSLEQFEKWLKANIYDQCNAYTPVGKDDWENVGNDYDVFSKLPDSMKYGVLVDFFDSVGIYINIIGNVFHSYQLYVDSTLITHFDSRPQARTKAIDCANKIYNERSLKKYWESWDVVN